ncbi:MAG: hypothetical protein EA422_08695 [Gemmatimonadales bacterium]|nr:MAG: hypothetical protein EA422_08695 [Gemmatimonadales bacterium]
MSRPRDPRTGAPAPGLRRRVAALLQSGPFHTLELAERALGLRGPPAALSSAVFSLLGDDARFQVDARGIWSLAPGAGIPGPALSTLSYAVVDVETTGGAWRRGDRVTEVAVVPVTGGVIRDGLGTLVNPGRRIPPKIQGLTGITDPMVAGAPPFEGVAPQVEAALHGRIFVAHNVQFDWGFIRTELLNALGAAPELPLLCTVRLGRFLIPGLRRYNLDALTRHFGIPVHQRHRAYGDALATARLLLHLLQEAEAQGIADLPALEAALQRRSAPRSVRSPLR